MGWTIRVMGGGGGEVNNIAESHVIGWTTRVMCGGGEVNNIAESHIIYGKKLQNLKTMSDYCKSS
jgi:hypothetical protein